MSTGVVIVVAAIVVAAIVFLVYGFLQQPRRRREAEEGYGPLDEWPAQATLAEMRKEGASLPGGEEGNRPERPT